MRSVPGKRWWGRHLKYTLNEFCADTALKVQARLSENLPAIREKLARLLASLASAADIVDDQTPPVSASFATTATDFTWRPTSPQARQGRVA